MDGEVEVVVSCNGLELVVLAVGGGWVLDLNLVPFLRWDHVADPLVLGGAESDEWYGLADEGFELLMHCSRWWASEFLESLPIVSSPGLPLKIPSEQSRISI